MKKTITLITTFLLIGCATTKTVNNKLEPKAEVAVASDKVVYNRIYKDIKSNNLDNADDEYVKLKSDYENSPYLKDATAILAIAHMQKKEYILANFYIQEGLQIDSGNTALQYALIKNQFNSALLVKSDSSYIKKALESLQSNVNLISDSEYQTLANSYITRLKLEDTYRSLQTGSLYKRLGKKDASNIYQNRALQNNIDVKSIYKP